MQIITSRKELVYNLLSYGELETAYWARVASVSQLEDVFDRAYKYALDGRLLAHALATAAVEVHEGVSRELARARRDLKGAEKLLEKFSW